MEDTKIQFATNERDYLLELLAIVRLKSNMARDGYKASQASLADLGDGVVFLAEVHKDVNLTELRRKLADALQ